MAPRSGGETVKLDTDQVAALHRVLARLEAHLELLQDTDAPAVILIEEEVLLVRALLEEAEGES